MRSTRTCVFATGVAAIALGIYAEKGFSGKTELTKNDPVGIAVQKGLKWLVSVQGNDGGWGQDGGETSYVRQGERLESKGNDVANTAVAAEALLHAGNTPVGGEYREALQRAIRFILQHVEQSPAEGLAVTDLSGTQIQRKLGPFIDTFLTSKLLAELDGAMGDARANLRVRQSLQKCVAKIEKNQLQDGSWNIAGGWAPILGTSVASRGLYLAQQKGVAVSTMAMARVDEYTVKQAEMAPSAGFEAGRHSARGSAVASGGISAGVVTGVVGGVPGGVAGGIGSAPSAGVSLYQGAQELEQLSRTEADRAKNAKRIAVVTNQLSDARFVTGFGSMGGEEFFSYLNVSDSLHRTGGPTWEKWNSDIKTKVVRLQNEDGTWSGHHCITGRVAVTSAAILTLLADRDVAVLPTHAKKNR